VATHGENAVKLHTLSEKHKMVASLMAQGLGRSEIASAIGYTPEYITWLTRDPLFKNYLQEMSEHTDARLEAMFDQVADVVSDGMRNGSMDERLKAARLLLEVTGRVGKFDRPYAAMDSSLERLNILAERLLKLQSKVRMGEVFNVQDHVTILEDPSQRDEQGSMLQVRRPQIGEHQP